jgi:phosphoribosyl 1,2-cyclic phosphate phosphodiesterase
VNVQATFLGTGTSQGVPVIACTCPVCTSLDYRDKRLRSSLHLRVDGKSIVIDTGPDFRQQMLRERVGQLDAIVFTHSHKDHVAGLDDVRAYNYLQQGDIPVYGTREVFDQLKKEFYYAFEPVKYPGIPQLELVEINELPFEAAGIPFLPLPVKHLHMPVLGFRVGNLSYITDANFIPESTFQRLRGTRTLVLNALQKEKHLSHFNLEEALEVAKKVGAEKTYFIHISHKLGLHQEIEAQLPPSVALAYDGLTVTA